MNLDLSGKTILITGGTGSFGSVFLESVSQQNPYQIRVFSRDEKKQHDLRQRYSSSNIKFIIGDVRDQDSVESATRNVDYIFHAAALKQVPSCEFYPLQAFYTNVVGTQNVLKCALANDVKKVVVLSTDKAVYPINAMGLSKAMMEKVASSYVLTDENPSTLISITRYGNVMASRGSVIPLFVRQILEKRPLTITNPSMTRFLLSLEESVELVYYAFANGFPGDLFVKKAPSATIDSIAKALLDIFNATNPIEIIGTRHGEKQYESLLSREELSRAIDLGDFYRVPSDNRDLNYSKYFDKGQTTLLEQDYNSNNSLVLSTTEVKSLLLSLPYIQECLNA